jgi:hypothetical protein
MSQQEQRHFLIINTSFALLCGLVLGIDVGTVGQQLFSLSLIYNIVVGIWAYASGHQTWKNIWTFAFAFGCFNIFPDWFLSSYLQTLYYPDEGIFKIGSIGGYMPFLWAIPMFMVLGLYDILSHRLSSNTATLWVVCLAMLTYGLSEHCFKLLDSWQAQHVRYLVGNAAVYVLVAELQLVVGALFLYKIVSHKPFLYKIMAAFVLMIFYFGSLCFWWFLIENKLGL